MNYYEILGVEKTATEDEIKKAFRKKAMECHPDKNPGNKDAEEKFKTLNEANSVLSDPDKRSQYDRFGSVGNQHQGHPDMSDIFSHFGFGGFGGFGDGRRQRKGGNLQVHINLTLKEIFTGVNKKLK